MKSSYRRELLRTHAFGLAVTLTAAFGIAFLLILLVSEEPSSALYYFFIGPFTSRYAVGNMLNTAIPLIFTGLGIAIAFTSSNFNLGGEGQIYTGALLTTAVCLAIPQGNGLLVGLLAVLTGIAGGALLAGLSGFLQMKWGTNLLISTFLISSAVVLIINYMITGPMDDPASSLLATPAVGGQFRLAALLPPSKLDVSLLFGGLTAVGTFILVYYTHWGYEMRMCGLNSEFARYGGIRTSSFIIIPMLISGGLHGAGGGLVVLGTHYMAIKEMTFGMGWNGIAVALIAMNNPLGVIPAALLFAYLSAGANAAMLHTSVTFEIATIVQAVIFYLITAQALYTWIHNRRGRRIP